MNTINVGSICRKNEVDRSKFIKFVVFIKLLNLLHFFFFTVEIQCDITRNFVHSETFEVQHEI